MCGVATLCPSCVSPAHVNCAIIILSLYLVFFCLSQYCNCFCIECPRRSIIIGASQLASALMFLPLSCSLRYCGHSPFHCHSSFHGHSPFHGRSPFRGHSSRFGAAAGFDECRSAVHATGLGRQPAARGHCCQYTHSVHILELPLCGSRLLRRCRGKAMGGGILIFSPAALVDSNRLAQCIHSYVASGCGSMNIHQSKLCTLSLTTVLLRACSPCCVQIQAYGNVSAPTRRNSPFAPSPPLPRPFHRCARFLCRILYPSRGRTHRRRRAPRWPTMAGCRASRRRAGQMPSTQQEASILEGECVAVIFQLYVTCVCRTPSLEIARMFAGHPAPK